MPTIHLLIKGKVQGVFYRATAKKEAAALGITGWVKNTDEGDVELVATGDERALKDLISWCRSGPSGAIVTTIEKADLPEENFAAFEIMK